MSFVWDVSEIVVLSNLYVIYKSQDISAVLEDNCSAFMRKVLIQ